MNTDYKEKLRGKAISALMKDAHANFKKGNSKTFNKMVNQSGLLEDAEKDWPRFMAMIRSEIVRYIRERDPRTKEYKQARKEENRKQKDEKVATDGQKKDKAAREGLETMEIERQFLVTDMLAVPINASIKCYNIRQGYLSFEPELRIRQIGDKYFFTFKSVGGLVRREEEFSISKDDFENLLPMMKGAMLEKVRREIPLTTGEIAVFDLYGGELSGLCMAEVEFKSVEEAKAFNPPAWFGKEITYDARLTAANLVRHGRRWFEDIIGNA